MSSSFTNLKGNNDTINDKSGKETMHTTDNHEREVKFFILDQEEMRGRLSTLGATLLKNRVYEINLRFDTASQTLREKHQVLRLRKDDQNHLTFKDQADLSNGIADRRELEITIDNFDVARSILEALGYHVFMIYEKYRTTYQFKKCEIVLDELPFGFFIEIEGLTIDAIHSTANELGLDWEKRITLSYLDLFNNLKVNKKLQIENIVFESFEKKDFIESDFA
ncbi:MAG: class IV adenylate cyclase [Anaerolineaceae bacterium]